VAFGALLLEPVRLVFFCSDLDLDRDLEHLDEVMAEPFAQAGLAGACLQRSASADGVAEAGWAMVEVSTKVENADALLAPQLIDLVRRLARARQERVIGLVVGSDATAQAVLHDERGFPRTASGVAHHVIRQTASWLEADAAPLARFFSAPAPPPHALNAMAELSAVSPEPPPRGPMPLTPDADDDDRFVDEKLRHARELMDQYLAGRK
jgi:hypothetical protein